MKNAIKWMAGLLLSPVLLFLILAALLYLPPVQNWVADKVAAMASEKTGMEISVGTVRLEWPLDLGIDDFLIRNMWNDTIAYAGHLTVDVQLRPLFSKRVVINEVQLQHAVFDTFEAISDLEVSGRAGELWLRSNGIDLDKETVEVNGARLQDADLDIALSDTAAVDTTTSDIRWRINADSLSIYRSAVAVHLPGDTLNIKAYMSHAVARKADIDLGTGTYQIGSLDWFDGRLSYDDKSQPATEGLDYNHMALSDIRLGIDSIYYGREGTSLYIRETALKEKSGLQVTELTGSIKLDTAFTHVEMPHLTLRTPDSDIEAEVSTDFNIADTQSPAQGRLQGKNPGKMKVRLNAQIGKQDLMRFAGNLPQQVIRQYPNHPLSIKGSASGNMQRMEFAGLDVHLPTALHLKADGYAYHVDDINKLRAQVSLKGETQNLNFVKPLLPRSDLRLPPMTFTGLLKADHGRYDADLSLREGAGTLTANIAMPRPSDITSYQADIKVRRLNLYHFLPIDTLLRHTADITADATLKNGHALATITGRNTVFDGTIGVDALVSTKRLQATITPHLSKADLFRLGFSDQPLTVGMDGDISINSDLKQNHEAKGLLSSLYITDAKGTYHPENVGFLARTNRDTTLARIQSGDFIVKLDGSGYYERLMKQGGILLDTLTKQYQNKIIDQAAIKRLLPNLKLHVQSGRNNPIANILRTKDIDFRDLFVDLNTSAETGINGNMYLHSLVYDSTRIDTVKLTLTQKGERLTYQGQVRNSRKNPQFVFNALFDGHIHEHGALAGLRYYDDQGRMGVRLGATASMVDEGIRINLMPDRPTIGYKEFNLNKDNYLLIDKNNRLKAKVDLIADDKAGVKIYSEESETSGNYLQDLTVSLNRINLGELTAVMPYLPRITGYLNGDYHIVMDQDERISVVSDMGVSNMAYEGAAIGNLSTELVYMQREEGGHAVEARLMLDDEEFGLLRGSLIPSPTPTGEGSIDATFTMTRFPLSIANGFVPDQIIGLDGYGEGELTIKGPTGKPIVNGEVYLDSAYLVSQPYGVRMRFDNDPVRIVGSHLLLENFGLYAYNDEPLNLHGDIDFSDLDRMSMNMRMRARNLQIINARQEAKSIAFGKAFVNFFAQMNGPLDALKMRGRLDVLGSTDLTYMLLDSPLSTDNRLDELVKFTDFNDSVQTAATRRPTPSGMDMDLTVNVSQGAHIVCNLNAEQTNYVDLMGGGDLRMRYGSEGLTLTGRYTLANGEMKYSLPVIPLKTFTIQDGSYVEFTGDPMNPRLNITATERTKAPVSQEGTQGRNVTFDCGVVITKTLNDMGLQFIISAPEDNAINSELQAMSTEERGKLAVTMLTTGMYLADGNTSGFSMNSALSSFLQSEINNITGSALKTLDLSVGLDNTTDASGSMHTDYSFKFSKRFFDNRLKIQLGGKVSSGQADAPGQQQSFFDNVTMEYRLDQSATKNVKLFYQQNVYDWLDGYTGLYGGGFVWRKKMDSLLDVFKIFSRDTQQPPMPMRRDSIGSDTLKTVRR
ncbi:MAG: translocation/assembly module TamB domain-containing protein [Prevotella sp.]|nr:translocation/assembly module TamB domain-containing protein [Prevotella sp.]